MFYSLSHKATEKLKSQWLFNFRLQWIQTCDLFELIQMSLYCNGHVLTIWFKSIFVKMKLMRKMRSNQGVGVGLQKEQLTEKFKMRMRYDRLINLVE